MGDNYKFFQHIKCEYFPCHDIKDVSKFNCLFCYCPLYLVEDCGGKHTYSGTIKNCTDCMVPHMENGYDYIIKKIINRNNEKR